MNAWVDHIRHTPAFSRAMPSARAIVRRGGVSSLLVRPGHIEATVHHNGLLHVVIRVAPLTEATRQALRDACAHTPLASLDLLAGRVPPALLTPQSGLLPAPSALSSTCTCTDRPPCRHMVAVLLTVAHHPDHLLVLRDIAATDLIAAPADCLDPLHIAHLFDVDLDHDPTPAPRPPPKRLPAPVPTPRTVHPLKRPRPHREPLLDAIFAALIAALHGARCFGEARVVTRSLQPALKRSALHLGALERFASHCTPAVLQDRLQRILDQLARGPARESLPRRIRRIDVLPPVWLHPTPDGGLTVVGPFSDFRLVPDTHLPPKPFDPDRVFEPFVAVAHTLHIAHGRTSDTAQHSWQAGAGRTLRGIKAALSRPQNE